MDGLINSMFVFVGCVHLFMLIRSTPISYALGNIRSVMNYLLRYFIKRVLENVIKRAKGSLNNIFQDKFNKILSQQSTDVRFFLSHN